MLLETQPSFVECFNEIRKLGKILKKRGSLLNEALCGKNY